MKLTGEIVQKTTAEKERREAIKALWQFMKPAKRFYLADVEARIPEMPEELLDKLADFFKAEWDKSASLDEKREKMKKEWVIFWHRGTPAAVKAATGDVELREWFNTGGEPYTFRVAVDGSERFPQGAERERIVSAVARAKNARSHLDGLDALVTARARLPIVAEAEGEVIDRDDCSYLVPGKTINSRIHSTTIAIKRAAQLPDGFQPNASNAISLPESPMATYMFYDAEEKTEYIYSKAKRIYMNPNSDQLFSECWKLIDISALRGLDTSKVTRMYFMFFGCNSLTDINALSNWDVSNVTDMSDMFNSCSSLTDISALSNWDVSNVTDMSNMFTNCSSLTDINALSNWDVSNVTDMRFMFFDCSSLTDISALSNWDVSNVTAMSNMFSQCNSLTDINALSNWDVSNVTDMSNMFNYCSNLTDISALSNWNISKVKIGGFSRMIYKTAVKILPIWNGTWDVHGSFIPAA